MQLCSWMQPGKWPSNESKELADWTRVLMAVFIVFSQNYWDRTFHFKHTKISNSSKYMQCFGNFLSFHIYTIKIKCWDSEMCDQNTMKSVFCLASTKHSSSVNTYKNTENGFTFHYKFFIEITHLHASYIQKTEAWGFSFSFWPKQTQKNRNTHTLTRFGKSIWNF